MELSDAVSLTCLMTSSASKNDALTAPADGDPAAAASRSAAESFWVAMNVGTNTLTLRATEVGRV